MKISSIVALWTFALIAARTGSAQPEDVIAILRPNAIAAPINPLMVGIYSARFRCAKGETRCDPRRLAAVDRIVVADSFLNTGVWITVSSKSKLHHVDRFLDSLVGEDGNFVSAAPSERFGTPGVFNYVELRFNPVANTFDGELIHGNSLSKYVLDAKPLRTVAQFYSSYPPVEFSVAEIEGAYHGRIGSYAGTLVVREMPDGTVAGRFESDKRFESGLPVSETSFSSGHWNPERGILQLTFTLPRLAGLGVLALAFRGGSAKHPRFEGFQFASFADLGASFVKK